MIMLNETNTAARALGVSESKLRALVKRGVVQPTAKTDRGTVLFNETDIERARRQLELTGRKQ